MYCKNCGNKIDDDAKFCDKCGAVQYENSTDFSKHIIVGSKSNSDFFKKNIKDKSSLNSMLTSFKLSNIFISMNKYFVILFTISISLLSVYLYFLKTGSITMESFITGAAVFAIFGKIANIRIFMELKNIFVDKYISNVLEGKENKTENIEKYPLKKIASLSGAVITFLLVLYFLIFLLFRNVEITNFLTNEAKGKFLIFLIVLIYTYLYVPFSIFKYIIVTEEETSIEEAFKRSFSIDTFKNIFLYLYELPASLLTPFLIYMFLKIGTSSDAIGFKMFIFALISLVLTVYLNIYRNIVIKNYLSLKKIK